MQKLCNLQDKSGNVWTLFFSVDRFKVRPGDHAQSTIDGSVKSLSDLLACYSLRAI